MLYSFGSNGSGQLGVGHADDLSKPATSSFENDSGHGHIKQLATGGNHTIVLFDDGTIGAAGNNEDGRCGLNSLQEANAFTDVVQPTGQNGNPLRVKQVAATWASTTLLCDDGRLYVCGTGNSGELGLGSEIENVTSWQTIAAFPPEGTNILSIASGMAHNAVVLSNGEVHGWGKGRKGQLGELAEDVWSPRKITGFDFLASQAVCGRDFTLIVGEPSTGHFAVLGSGSNDRFGIKANASSSLIGRTDIAASWCSIYVLMATGEMVAWGRDDHGQLPPPDLPKLAAIAAGSEHCLALTQAGEVLAWGWGEHGNCGLPTDENGDVKARWNEIQVPGHVSGIFAGCATSFILVDG